MSSDKYLFAKLQEGDITAFDSLYQKYERPLFGFIYSYTKDIALAEDVFQEAFLFVLKKGKSGENITNFRAWIYKVSRNLCLNNKRTKARRKKALKTIKEDPNANHDNIRQPIDHPHSLKIKERSEQSSSQTGESVFAPN